MSEQTPDLGAMVSKLLSNPELISQIASTVGIDAPPQAEGAPKRAADTEAQAADAKAQAASAPSGGAGTSGGGGGAGLDAILPVISMLGGAGGGGSGLSARRCALLSALKPYCNEHRCKTIDYMIGISKLSDTFIPKRG
ncbi:MAG: hypothetical protein ACI3XI_02325 [Eubacteriales bacterium]